MLNKRFFSWLMALVLVSQLLGGLVPPAGADYFGISAPWEVQEIAVDGEQFCVSGVAYAEDTPQPVRVTAFSYAGVPSENGLVYERNSGEYTQDYIPWQYTFDGYVFEGIVFIRMMNVVLNRISLAEPVTPIEHQLTFSALADTLKIKATGFNGGNLCVNEIQYDGNEVGVIYNNVIDVPAVTKMFKEKTGDFNITGYIMMDGSAWWITSVEHYPSYYPCTKTLSFKVAQIQIHQVGPGVDGLDVIGVEFNTNRYGIVYYDPTEVEGEGYGILTDDFRLDLTVIPICGGADVVHVHEIERIQPTPEPIPAPQPEPIPAPQPEPNPITVWMKGEGDITYLDTASVLDEEGVRWRNVEAEETKLYPAQCLAIPAVLLNVTREYKAPDGVLHAHVTWKLRATVYDGAVRMSSASGEFKIVAVGFNVDLKNAVEKTVIGLVYYNQDAARLFKGDRVRMVMVESGATFVFTAYAVNLKVIGKDWDTKSVMGWQGRVKLSVKTVSCGGGCYVCYSNGLYSAYYYA